MTAPSAELTLAARTTPGPDRYRFQTTDGLCSAESFRTPELLLLESLWDRDVDRLLCPQANYVVVGVVMAHAGAEVTMTETSARARDCCDRNAAANDASASVEPETWGRDAVTTLMTIPTTRSPNWLPSDRLTNLLTALRRTRIYGEFEQRQDSPEDGSLQRVRAGVRRRGAPGTSRPRPGTALVDDRRVTATDQRRSLDRKRTGVDSLPASVEEGELFFPASFEPV